MYKLIIFCIILICLKSIKSDNLFESQMNDLVYSQQSYGEDIKVLYLKDANPIYFFLKEE